MSVDCLLSPLVPRHLLSSQPLPLRLFGYLGKTLCHTTAGLPSSTIILWLGLALGRRDTLLALR